MKYLIISSLALLHLTCMAQAPVIKRIEIRASDSVWHHEAAFMPGWGDGLNLFLPKDSLNITLDGLNGPERILTFNSGKILLEFYLHKNKSYHINSKTMKANGSYITNGDCSFFDNKGHLKQISTWKNGRLIKITHFDSAGNISPKLIK